MGKTTTEAEARTGRIELSRDLVWPLAIAVALAIVVIVNVVFIYIAVREPDPVDPSYVAGER